MCGIFVFIRHLETGYLVFFLLVETTWQLSGSVPSINHIFPYRAVLSYARNLPTHISYLNEADYRQPLHALLFSCYKMKVSELVRYGLSSMSRLPHESLMVSSPVQFLNIRWLK